MARIINVAVVLGPSIFCGGSGIKTMDAALCNADRNRGNGLVGSDAR